MRHFPHLKLGRLRLVGAPVFVHWSVWAASAVLMLSSSQKPLNGVIAIACYLSIILVHECGHALAAKRYRVRATGIYLGFLHGRCTFSGEDSFYEEKEELIVVWGGVLAQLAVALPILIAEAITGFSRVYPFGAVVMYLGHVSLVIAALNLIPFPGQDGEKAWRLPPLLWREWRARRGRGQPKRRKLRAIK